MAASRHQPPRYDTFDRTQSSYATPLRGDAIEWAEPSRQREHDVFFHEGSAVLDRRAKLGLAAVARRIGVHANVHIIGRDDDSLKQDLWDIRAKVLRASLVENGIPPANIKVLRADETGGPPARETLGSSYRKAALLPSHIRWFPTATGGPASGITQAVAVASAPMHTPSASRFFVQRSDINVETVLRRWANAAGYQVRWEAPVAPVIGDFTFVASGFLEAVALLIQELRSTGYSMRLIVQGDRVVRIVKAD